MNPVANPLRPADGQTGDEPAAGTQQHTEPQQPQGVQQAVEQARPVVVQHLDQRLRRREEWYRQHGSFGGQPFPDSKQHRQQRQPLAGMQHTRAARPPVAIAQRQQQQAAAEGELRQRPAFAKRPAPPGVGPGQSKQTAQQPQRGGQQPFSPQRRAAGGARQSLLRRIRWHRYSPRTDGDRYPA